MSTPATSPSASDTPANTPAALARHLPAVTAAMTRKARFWNRIARRYAADPIADPAGYETTLARVEALLTPTARVLELGCGTGSTALRLAPGAGRWLGTDLSAEMIAIAREKLAATPMASLHFAVADAEVPAFGRGDWDRVTAFNLLHLVDDLTATLAVAWQALAPGGLFISKTPCLCEMNPLLRAVLPLTLPLLKALGLAPPVHFFDAATLKAALVQQGFVIDAVERHGTRGKDFRVFIVARKPDAA